MAAAAKPDCQICLRRKARRECSECRQDVCMRCLSETGVMCLDCLREFDQIIDDVMNEREDGKDGS